MLNTIKELLSINYTDVKQDVNYKELAYNILDTLNKEQLMEIIDIENIILLTNNRSINYLKEQIIDNLVSFRVERQILGCVAAATYWE